VRQYTLEERVTAIEVSLLHMTALAEKADRRAEALDGRIDALERAIFKTGLIVGGFVVISNLLAPWLPQIVSVLR
jgi:hypothetical protein